MSSRALERNKNVVCIAGCVALAVTVCYLAPEYGHQPMYFFAGCFYALTGLVRLRTRWLSDIS